MTRRWTAEAGQKAGAGSSNITPSFARAGYTSGLPGSLTKSSRPIRPIDSHHRPGRDKPVDTEILGENADDPTVDKEQMATGGQLVHETLDPPEERLMRIPFRHGEIAEPHEDPGVGGIHLVEGHALVDAEVALPNPGIGTA